jgi:sec-independent protein translocase protein TatB
VFDLGWSKLIIIAMLAIVVVGPKDLPALLRAIGKFVGQIRRQADEFRRQFDEAMKDTELDQIRKDVEDIKRTATESVRDIERSAEDSVKPLETAASEITQLGNGTTPDAAAPAEIATELPPDVTALPQIPATPALPTSAPGSLTKAGA